MKVGDKVIYIGNGHPEMHGNFVEIKGIAANYAVVCHNHTLCTIPLAHLTKLYTEAKMWPDNEYTLLGPDGLYYKPDFDVEYRGQFVKPPKPECECGQEKAQPGSPGWMHSDWCKLYKKLV